MGFSRKEYWSGLTYFLLQEIFLIRGSNLRLPHCRQTLYHLSHQGSPKKLTQGANSWVKSNNNKMYSWRDKEWSKIAHTECLMKRNGKHYWNSEQGERKQEGGCVSVWLKSYSRSPYWQTVRYCELVLLLYLRVYYLFFFPFWPDCPTCGILAPCQGSNAGYVNESAESWALDHQEIWRVCYYYRRRQRHPTPVLLPGKCHRWRSLEGCSPWGR